MKTVILEGQENAITLNEVPESTLIFAVKERKLAGTVIKEEGGWVVRIKNGNGVSGYHGNRKNAIEGAAYCGYTFVIDIEVKND